MKEEDKKALLEAAKFVVRLGKAHDRIDDEVKVDRECDHEPELRTWVHCTWGEVELDEQGALEDPRKALGEHYHRIAVLVADLEGEG